MQKRKEQNRLAQRNFREKTKLYVRGLEGRVRAYEVETAQQRELVERCVLRR